jgi:hypothetical protein
MAGILDNKKRIMDTIVTQEGRRQLSSGNFKIKYASFTDGNVFYEEDLLTGTTDATLRIPFEVVNKFQDNIVFETDDSGNLLSFQGTDVELNPDGSVVSLTSTYPNDTRIYNGKVVVEQRGPTTPATFPLATSGLYYFSYYEEDTKETIYWIYGYADDATDSDGDGTDPPGDGSSADSDGYGWFLTDSTYAWPVSADKLDMISTENFITSTVSSRSVVTDIVGFSDAVDSITAASFESFNQQNFITTKGLRYTDKFSITAHEDLKFDYMLNTDEWSGGVIVEKELNTLPAFVHDKKLSRVLNFKFLPPINKNDRTPNGNFKDLNEGHYLEDQTIINSLRAKQKITLQTIQSSENNNIILQVFEKNEANTKVTKLDTIDFGTIKKNDKTVKIVFVGKVVSDAFNQPTFLNIFTLEFEDGK